MNVGVIADGVTDRQILLKMVECVIPCFNCFELRRQSFRDSVDKYWSDVGDTDNYWFSQGNSLQQNAALKLKGRILTILCETFYEFKSLMTEEITDHDIIIINTDAERHLVDPSAYFNNCWAFGLKKIFMLGIEDFCHQMIHQGYKKKNLPLVIPIVPFPSTDILIAAAREIPNYYGKRARELKEMIYDTHNLRDIQDDDLENLALSYITPEGINLIFERIPESRFFINFLLAIANNKNPIT
jgi:hypothetical protein